MSLFTATIIIATLLLIKGSIWLFNPNFVRNTQIKLFRSNTASLIFFGSASLWFLYELSNLGPADFGQYKYWLMLLFGAVSLGCFKYVKDFLPIRGIAILILLLAKHFLDAAYLEPQTTRLFLVAYCYLMILTALFLGTVPYKALSFSNWLAKKPVRFKYFAFGFLSYGSLLTITAFTY